MAKKKADTRGGDRHATGTAKTIRFTDEQLAILADAKTKRGGGTMAEVIETAVRAYMGKNSVSASDVIAWVKSHDA